MSARGSETPGLLRLTVDGPNPLVVELEPPAPGPGDIAEAGQGAVVDPAPVALLLSGRSPSDGGPARYEIVVDGWRFEVVVESAARADLRERASRAALRGLGSGRQVVRAQIPGRIVAVAVLEGEVVEAGQRLLSVEAMKMENAVLAPWAGTIVRIGVGAGQTVELGDELVVIE